jgi:NADH dehydrogenase/NADH:ubiquinone oxidoreductase subunit G
MSDMQNQGASRAPESQMPHGAKERRDGLAKALVDVTIDGHPLQVTDGTTILEAARQIGVRIPTLCAHQDLCMAGLCRVCVVEIEGMRTLQASCAFPINQPMKVFTHTRKVRQARRHIIDLLLSRHYGECYACGRNNNCELQALSKEYGVDFFRFGHPEEPMYQVDRSSHSVVRDMNKCILCRRCVRTCIDMQEVGCLEAVNRGNHTRITTFMDKPLAEVVCINCGQCINRCPTGALRANDPTDEVWAAIDDPRKHVVIQTAPAPRAAIGECFGVEPGRALTFEMNTALRLAGFDKIFDTNFTAD